MVAAWFHYMCDQKVHTPGQGPVPANDGNVESLFAAVAARQGVGISLWGSVGNFKGEDPLPSKVAEWINKVWGPHIIEHCDLPYSSHAARERETSHAAQHARVGSKSSDGA